jgi:hypothetical protein
VHLSARPLVALVCEHAGGQSWRRRRQRGDMPKDRKRAKRIIAQRAATARREPAKPDSLVVDAQNILSDLAAQEENYRLVYYRVEPRWLSDDLNVPIDGRIHAHAPVVGKQLHLPETHRRNTIREASNGFTGPFIAVLRNPATAADTLGQAVIIQGANLSSEMLHIPLQIMMRARGQTRLDFAALIGMPVSPGEWTATSKSEVAEIVEKFQLRVEAEAVLAAAPFVPRED